MGDSDFILDAKGLNCPLPILRTKKAISGLTSGQVLIVEATDPGTTKDVNMFCKQTGNTLLDMSEKEGVYVFKIRKN